MDALRLIPAAFFYSDEDTPFTTVTQPHHPQMMNNFREEEIKAGASPSTGETDTPNCSTLFNLKRIMQFFLF